MVEPQSGPAESPAESQAESPAQESAEESTVNFSRLDAHKLLERAGAYGLFQVGWEENTYN